MTYGMKRFDHQETEQKFLTLRKLTYSATMDEFPDIEVKGISYTDAVEADRWKNFPKQGNRPQRGDWEWTKEFPYYQNRPNRFEISLRKGGVLCALSYGQLSKKGTRMRMNLIESTPIRPTPLGIRALPVLAYAAAIFADISGADELWVIDPDPDLETIYKDEGFSSREIYHGRRVGQRRIL